MFEPTPVLEIQFHLVVILSLELVQEVKRQVKLVLWHVQVGFMLLVILVLHVIQMVIIVLRWEIVHVNTFFSVGFSDLSLRQ